jgi:hypothetical protein
MNQLATIATTPARWIASATLAAAALTGSLSTAQLPSEAAQNSRTIALTVYDHAHISQSTLRTAEAEASRILAAAGLRARWVECPAIAAEPVCNSATPANGYILRLLANSSDASSTAHDELATTNDRRPASTSIFYNRVAALAGGNTSPSGVLLGRVMARQVGILLLGTVPLSHRGILQAHWSEQQLDLLAGGNVLFTPQQARSMQARLNSQTPAPVSIAQR